MQFTSYSRTLRASLVMATLGASLAAQALTISQSFSLPLVRTSLTRAVSLAKFDTSLGTLTSIDFSLTGTIQTDMRLANLSKNSPNTITGTVQGNFKIATGGTTLLTGVPAAIVHSGTFDKSLNGTTPDYTNNRGKIYPQDVQTNTANPYTSSTALAAVFSAVSGVGNVNFDVTTASSDTSTDSAGNSSFETDTFGAASGTVRYNYTPVPEPGSMAALGLGALALVRRRKGAGR